MLAGAGYEARALDGGAVLDASSAALAGVDVVLLMPRLGDEREGALLGVMEGDPATAAVPVLRLSTVPGEGPDERTGSVPWPCSIGALVRVIEQAVLAPAYGDEAS